MASAAFQSVEALLFDTFGTTVDWRGSLIAYLERFGREHSLTGEWAALADAWRAHYKPAIQSVSEGRRPWANFDALHRETLDRLLPQFGLENLSNAQRDELVRGWERLRGWPDTVSGIERLKRRFIVGPLSNGNVRQLTNMAKFAGLPWDLILGADTFHHYKPDAEVYLGAAALLNCPADAVVMVAAHNNDLKSARACGMKTAFVRRQTEDPEPEGEWDLVANDFEHLADQLAA